MREFWYVAHRFQWEAIAIAAGIAVRRDP